MMDVAAGTNKKPATTRTQLAEPVEQVAAVTAVGAGKSAAREEGSTIETASGVSKGAARKVSEKKTKTKREDPPQKVKPETHEVAASDGVPPESAAAVAPRRKNESTAKEKGKGKAKERGFLPSDSDQDYSPASPPTEYIKIELTVVPKVEVTEVCAVPTKKGKKKSGRPKSGSKAAKRGRGSGSEGDEESQPKRKLAPAEKIDSEARLAIMEALSAPKVRDSIGFDAVATSFGGATTGPKLSRHWREVLSSDLRAFIRTGEQRSGKPAKVGGVSDAQRAAIWKAVAANSGEADWKAVAQATGVSTTKLRRHFRDVLNKDIIQFINA